MKSIINMRNTIKKTVSLILVIAMLIAILPNLTLPTSAAETTAGGGTAFERDKKIYTEYLLNGGYEDLLLSASDKNGCSVQSAMYDFDRDGTFELLAGLNTTKPYSVAGFYTIIDGKVQKLLSSYDSPYTFFGGSNLNYAIDNRSGKPVIITISIVRDGVNFFHHETTAYTVINGTVERTSFKSHIRILEEGTYNNQIPAVKKETALYYTDDSGYFGYYMIDGQYVAENTYNALFTNPIDDNLLLKNSTIDNPIPYTNVERTTLDGVVWNGHTYKVFANSMTWTEAKAFCEEKGGHLVTITSKDETSFVTSLLNSESIRNCYWIGMWRDNTSSAWKWVTGEDVNYYNWAENEPRNIYEGNSENYVHLFAKEYTQGTGIKRVGTWNDAANGGAGYANSFYSDLGFICEWDSIENPDPGNGKKAIIVVPGITGSELFALTAQGYSKVWIEDSDIIEQDAYGKITQYLPCNSDGSSIDVFHVTAPIPNDNSDSFGTIGTYTNMVKTLQRKYDSRFGGTGEYDVHFFAYDWRLTNTKAAEQLNRFISEYDKVVLVCHSMGGIVASLYMAQFGHDKVEKLITLGTPYYGAPKAIYALETGMFLDGLKGILSSFIIKPLISNMPGVYELVPSAGYYRNGNYCILDLIKNRSFETYDQTTQLLSKRKWYNSVVFDNAELVFKKEYQHGSVYSIYQKIINNSINSFVIVGYNQNTLTCLSNLTLTNDGDILDSFDDIDVNIRGDGTVPLISSTLNNASFIRSPYYIDGKDYKRDGKNGIDHTGLASDDRTIKLVQNIIDNKGDDPNHYDDGCGGVVSRSISISKGITGYKIKAACPVIMSILDDSGKVIGSVSSDEIISSSGHENDFYVCGNNNEIKIAYIDEDSYKDILIKGYDSGSMDLEIVHYRDGEVISEDSYSNVEITDQTKIEASLEESVLLIDSNNDGKKDKEVYPDKSANPGNDGRIPFEDVKAGTYYYDPVVWAVNHIPQITNGTDTTHFSPNSTCTRAQVVTFLWRANGCPEPQGKGNPFTDVKPDAYYYKAVLWAVENGITSGTSKTTFSPNSGCTRGQVATFLYRFNDEPERKNSANPFGDVKSSQYYYEPVLWALETGVTTGTSETKFSPDNTCTRAQIVTFLYRSVVPRSPGEQAIRTDIRSLSVDDVVLFQNDDMITIDGVQRYDYESYARLHLTFSDGTGADATPWALRGSAGMALTFDDDQNSKAWGLGKHRVTATLNGLHCSFNVEVVQTPVKSAVISPMTVYEAVDGYFIDDEFYYDLNPRDITVTFKDGTVCENEMELDDYVMQKYHRNYYVFGSYFDNQIQAGRTIQATATILGLDVRYDVTVKKNPIQSVSVANLSILEGTNGWWGRTDTVYGWQYYYSLEEAVSQKTSVRTSDASFDPQEHLNGMNITMSNGDEIYEDQMAHPWHAGKTYSLLLHYAGKTYPFQMTILKSPIRSVSVAPLKLLQGENQYESYDINDFGSEVKYLEYEVWPNEYSVQLSDGSTISGSPYEVCEKIEEKYAGKYDGMFHVPQTITDQSPDHQWGIGEHVAFTGILGVLAPGTVTITPNPISSVTAIPVTVKAFTHGRTGRNWDEAAGAWKEDPSWYEYNLFDIVQVRVVYKDGTVKTGLLNEFYFDSNGGSISYYDPQNKDAPWGIGKHLAEIDFVGFHVTAEITIVS